MGMNDYLDRLEDELREQLGMESRVANMPDDADIRAIIDMEDRLGVNYSDEQKNILKHKGNACILACAGSGKALVNGSKVLTVDGYRNIEDLKVGQLVFDNDFMVQMVLGVYPQGKKRVWHVEFNTGRVVGCCREHLWTVKNPSGALTTLTTELLKMELKERNEEEGERKGSGTLFSLPHSNTTKDRRWHNLANKMVGIGIGEINELIRQSEQEALRNKVEIDSIHSVKTEEGLFGEVTSFDVLLSVIKNYLGKQLIIKTELASALALTADFVNIECRVDACDQTGALALVKFGDTCDSGIYVKSVVETNEYSDMTCIEVSGENKLYMIEGCIATHNTTVSTHLIAKRIKTGEISNVNKMIYTTYSKKGKEEMELRLNQVLNKLGLREHVEVRTIHSFFLQILRLFGVSSDIISEGGRTKLVKESVKEAGYNLKDDDLMVLDNLLSFQVNNLLSDKSTVECYVNTLEDLTLEQYSAIRRGYALKKQTYNNGKTVIDYDDMQSYLYLWLCKYIKSEKEAEVKLSLDVRNYCQALWSDFYIDEAQDVSKIQFEILRAMLTRPEEPEKLIANLVFIGDDDQCIYQWRGSDPSIILSIGPLFDMQTFVLSTNYRCKSEIVNYATTGIKCNSQRFQKGMQAHVNGGNVKIVQSVKEDLCSLSELAFNHINYWLSCGTDPKDIAVLCRNNFHLAILGNMLLRHGVYCEMTADMQMTKSYMYKDIKKLISIVEPCYSSEVMSDIMWKICSYMKVAQSSKLASFQNTSGLSLVDTLGFILRVILGLTDIDFSKSLKINRQAIEKMSYYAKTLSTATIDSMKAIYWTLTSNDSKEEKLKLLLSTYVDVSGYRYTSSDQKRSLSGLVNYIKRLLVKEGYDGMLNFLRVTEQYESGNVGLIGNKLTLSTIHSAKGREWKNVIMFACDNVSEPSFDNISRMLKDDVPISDIYERIDEERRLFYVGNTRAKENLLVITNKIPSVFMLEALGITGDTGNNDIIIDYARNPSYILSDYKDDIAGKISKPTSKYYYNAEDYKTE